VISSWDSQKSEDEGTRTSKTTTSTHWSKWHFWTRIWESAFLRARRVTSKWLHHL